VKLDNLIQIGHNVVVGHDTVAAAQVGIAGSSKVGSNGMFGGQVGIAGHLVVGDNVRVGSQSGVSHDVPDNTALMGSPALPGMKWHRSNAVFRNLPDLSLRIGNLEKEVRELKKR
jgi:UDP-3-O-[3-hydroxymyristoyl] glucosamine N-acyltransferase